MSDEDEAKAKLAEEQLTAVAPSVPTPVRVRDRALAVSLPTEKQSKLRKL